MQAAVLAHGPTLSRPPPTLTLWALSDVSSRSAEAGCRKIRDLRCWMCYPRLNESWIHGWLSLKIFSSGASSWPPVPQECDTAASRQPPPRVPGPACRGSVYLDLHQNTP